MRMNSGDLSISKIEIRYRSNLTIDIVHPNTQLKNYKWDKHTLSAHKFV